MGNHINAAKQFQSDKYPLDPDILGLAFKDPAARPALALFADRTKDLDLARDVKIRLKSIVDE